MQLSFKSITLLDSLMSSSCKKIHLIIWPMYFIFLCFLQGLVIVIQSILLNFNMIFCIYFFQPGWPDFRRWLRDASGCNWAGHPLLLLNHCPGGPPRLPCCVPSQGPVPGLGPREPAVPLHVPQPPPLAGQPLQRTRGVPGQRPCPSGGHQTQ